MGDCFIYCLKCRGGSVKVAVTYGHCTKLYNAYGFFVNY